MTAEKSRTEWFTFLFPEGTPQLWCPPLTHYDRDGAIDAARMKAHWAFLAPRVKGLLVPGSTGDGWELSRSETQQLIGLALERAEEFGLHILLGALRPTVAGAQEAIRDGRALFDSNDAMGNPSAGLESSRVCGFAVCPPRGAELSQAEIEASLSDILNMRFPIAIYQLPQVTQNEMGAELLERLANRFPNFLLFKDTSGADRVASSGLDLRGVFLVRGAEGGYAAALKKAGGVYDGFLLSTANSFSQQLHEVVELLTAGRTMEANQLSDRLAQLVDELFKLVANVREGNAFANAGKAVDHFFAHGRKAARLEPPRLHAGSNLPKEVILQTGQLLDQYGFMPLRGYLE